MKKDRFGNNRCDGYNTEDFVLCEDCVPNGDVKKARLDVTCRRCGGYGEYPRTVQPNGVNLPRSEAE